MAYENAKRILTNENARVAETAEGIYDDDIVILFWEGVESSYIDECIEWLNHADNSILVAPTLYDVVFAGNLYHLHAYYSENDQRLYRLMMQDAVQTSLITQSGTKWKHLMGETYAQGQSNIVLAMNNVDPAYVLAIQQEGLDESYTGTIYLLTGTVLNGELFNIKREAVLNQQTGLYTVRWYLSLYLSNEMGFIYQDGYNRKVTEIRLVETTAELKTEFFANTYIAPDGHWYYSTAGVPGTGAYTRMDGVTAAGTLPLDSALLATTVDGRTINTRSYYDEREKNWNIDITIFHDTSDTRISVLGDADTPIIDTRITLRQTPDAVMVIDEAYNITSAELTVFETYYGTTDALDTQGQIRDFKSTRLDNGNYNVMAIEITTTGFEAEFRIAGTMYYFGFHYPRKPTTDEELYAANSTEYHLLGADPSSPNTSTISSSVRPEISFVREDDGTWSWNIRITDEEEGEYTGGEGPPTPTGNKFDHPLFRYGWENDEWRWIGRFVKEEMPNQLNLVGQYQDIPANTYGTHSALSGRQLVVRELCNERVDSSGKLSYDVYENIMTADIEDDDGWYYLGVSSAVSRKRAVLAAETTNSGTPPLLLDRSGGSGENFFGGINITAQPPVLNVAGHAYMQFRSVKRERKYFVRRPTTADLTAAGVKTAMDNVFNSMGQGNENEMVTYDILRISQFSFAVEKLTVQVDPEKYDDIDNATAFEGVLFKESKTYSDFPS